MSSDHWRRPEDWVWPLGTVQSVLGIWMQKKRSLLVGRLRLEKMGSRVESAAGSRAHRTRSHLTRIPGHVPSRDRREIDIIFVSCSAERRPVTAALFSSQDLRCDPCEQFGSAGDRQLYNRIDAVPSASGHAQDTTESCSELQT